MRPETGYRLHIYVTFQRADGSWSTAVTPGEAVNPRGGRAGAPTLNAYIAVGGAGSSGDPAFESGR